MKKISFAAFGGPEVPQSRGSGGALTRAPAGYASPCGPPQGSTPSTEDPGGLSGPERIRSSCPPGSDWTRQESWTKWARASQEPRSATVAFGEGTDTHAEFAVLSARPDARGLSFEEAAGYPSVVATALRIIGEVGVRPDRHCWSAERPAASDRREAADRPRPRIAVIGIGRGGEPGLSCGPGRPRHDLRRVGWVERVRQLPGRRGPGPGRLRRDPRTRRADRDARKVVLSIADLGAPRPGVRFSGVAAGASRTCARPKPSTSSPACSAPHPGREVVLPHGGGDGAHRSRRAGHTRGRRAVPGRLTRSAFAPRRTSGSGGRLLGVPLVGARRPRLMCSSAHARSPASGSPRVRPSG